MSTSSFYDWFNGHTHAPGGREAADARLLADMRELHADDDTLGWPRMTVALCCDKGWRVTHKRVEDRMAIHGLAANRAAKRRSLTKPDASAPAIPDRVGGRFDPDHVDVTWVGDISAIPTGQGRPDLATVVDLASRRLLGSLHEPHPGCPAGRRRPRGRRGRPPAPLHGPSLPATTLERLERYLAAPPNNDGA